MADSSPFDLPSPRRVGVFSRGIMRIPHLRALLGADTLVFDPSDSHARSLDAVVGWGNKPNTLAPARFARVHELPFLRLEDGFLRSVGLGVDGAPPLSIVLDDRGIYYDSTKPSRLEAMLNWHGPRDPLAEHASLERARRMIAEIRRHGLSKYNDSPPVAQLDLGDEERPRVLVVDQTAGDMSITCGGLTEADYPRILDAALAENPHAEIIVKTHPDVLAGKRRGCVPQLEHDRVTYLAQHCHPFALFEQVERVYVGTSQLGFEALLADKPVSVFGKPFYAGWGITDDRSDVQRRARERSLEEVFAAAYLLYPRYRHPIFGGEARCEDVVEHLALQRSMFSRNRGHLLCIGFSIWKRAFVRDFLRCPGNEIEFVASVDEAKQRIRADSRVVVWGRKRLDGLPMFLEKHAGRVIRVEDGFLRSVGLGSDLVTPASLVFDNSGIYFDPNEPSDLETRLATAEFEEESLARTAALVADIVERRVSKYAFGQDRPLHVSAAPNQRIILVPGQVEDDASVQLGCLDVRTNGALIREARQKRPSAFLIYKPHPDVVSGNRKGAISDEERALCDLVVEDRSLDQCLDAVEEVHTMTSLVGFESLLRDKKVYVYGRPFYAGWSLTEDRHPIERRGRVLSLEALAAATLVDYPRYVDPETRSFTTPEAVIARLDAERELLGDRPARRPWLLRQAGKLLTAIQEIRRAR